METDSAGEKVKKERKDKISFKNCILTSDWVLSIAYTGQNIVVHSTHSLVKISNICLYHRDYIVIEALLRSQGNVLIGEPAQVQVKQIYVLSKIA